MKALTVKNPWAIFIALGWKRIENRDWAPPAHLIGTRIAIHAGAAKCRPIDEDDLEELLCSELFDSLKSEHRRLGLPVTIMGWRDLWESMRGRVVATATLKAIHRAPTTIAEDQRVWWVGLAGWELADLQRVTGPVIKGSLGLWELPVDYRALALISVAESQAGASVPQPEGET